MTRNTQTTWMLQTKRADFSALAQRFSISPVTARIIRNRDVVGEEEIRRYLRSEEHTSELQSPWN